jgi:hypothetical protein
MNKPGKWKAGKRESRRATLHRRYMGVTIRDGSHWRCIVCGKPCSVGKMYCCKSHDTAGAWQEYLDSKLGGKG